MPSLRKFSCQCGYFCLLKRKRGRWWDAEVIVWLLCLARSALGDWDLRRGRTVARVIIVCCLLLQHFLLLKHLQTEIRCSPIWLWGDGGGEEKYICQWWKNQFLLANDCVAVSLTSLVCSGAPMPLIWFSTRGQKKINWDSFHLVGVVAWSEMWVAQQILVAAS